MMIKIFNESKGKLVKEKKTMKKLLMLFVASSFLVGCKKEKIRDADYYYKNFDECKRQVEKCQNNPGKLEDTPNCTNAKAAMVLAVLSAAIADHKKHGTKKMPLIEGATEKDLQERREKK